MKLLNGTLLGIVGLFAAGCFDSPTDYGVPGGDAGSAGATGEGGAAGEGAAGSAGEDTAGAAGEGTAGAAGAAN